MEKTKKKLFQKSLERSSTKNRLISYSLMWMGLGVAIIFLLTYLVVSVPQIAQVINRFANSTSGWLILLFANMALIIGISFLSQKLSLPALIAMFLAFVIVQGIFVSTTVYYSGYGAQIGDMKNIFLLFLAPASIFVIMGLMGYFQFFDFSKIGPFLFFATLGLILFSVFLIFFGGPRAEKWFSLIGLVIFSLWIGFDVWWIQRTSEQIEASGGMSKQDSVRLGLIFGIRLFIDFVQVLLFLIRLMR